MNMMSSIIVMTFIAKLLWSPIMFCIMHIQWIMLCYNIISGSWVVPDLNYRGFWWELCKIHKSKTSHKNYETTLTKHNLLVFSLKKLKESSIKTPFTYRLSMLWICNLSAACFRCYLQTNQHWLKGEEGKTFTKRLRLSQCILWLVVALIASNSELGRANPFKFGKSLPNMIWQNIKVLLMFLDSHKLH